MWSWSSGQVWKPQAGGTVGRLGTTHPHPAREVSGRKAFTVQGERVSGHCGNGLEEAPEAAYQAGLISQRPGGRGWGRAKETRVLEVLHFWSNLGDCPYLLSDNGPTWAPYCLVGACEKHPSFMYVLQ